MDRPRLLTYIHTLVGCRQTHSGNIEYIYRGRWAAICLAPLVHNFQSNCVFRPSWMRLSKLTDCVAARHLRCECAYATIAAVFGIPAAGTPLAEYLAWRRSVECRIDLRTYEIEDPNDWRPLGSDMWLTDDFQPANNHQSMLTLSECLWIDLLSTYHSTYHWITCAEANNRRTLLDIEQL